MVNFHFDTRLENKSFTSTCVILSSRFWCRSCFCLRTEPNLFLFSLFIISKSMTQNIPAFSITISAASFAIFSTASVYENRNPLPSPPVILSRHSYVSQKPWDIRRGERQVSFSAVFGSVGRYRCSLWFAWLILQFVFHWILNKSLYVKHMYYYLIVWSIHIY